jgi:hypothetical protein
MDGMETPSQGRGKRAAFIGGALLVLLPLLLLLFLPRSRPGGTGGERVPAPVQPAPVAPPTAPPAPAPGPPGDAPDAGPDDSDVVSIVSGTVLDADGRPSSGALVWVGDLPQQGGWCKLSDENGRYEVRLRPGTHGVHARGHGTGTGSVEVVVPKSGAPVPAPDLRIPAGGVIRGTVLDRDGKPLPWFRVKCWSEADEWMEFLHEGRRFVLDGDDVLTDAKGEFALRGLSDGPHLVRPDLLMLPGWKADPPEAKGVKPGGEPLVFRAGGAARFRGLVVDGATGSPLASFAVAGHVLDAADGRFAVEVGEEPEVEVSAPGYEAAKVPLKDPAGADGERRVALARSAESGMLTLLVSGEGGETIEGLFVQLLTPDFRSWVRTYPAPAKEFPFGRAPAGDLTIFVRAEGWTPATLTATVPRDGEARPETKLKRCGSARVRILDAAGNVLRYPKRAVLRDAEGKGPPVRWIYMRPQGTLMAITEMQWTGDADGTDLNLVEADGRLTGLLPGTYRLEAGDGTRTKEAVFAVAGGEEVEVTVRLGAP